MLKEAEKLGFKKCIIPENNKKLLKEKLKLDIIGVKNIKDAMKEVRTIIKLKQDMIAYKRGGFSVEKRKRNNFVSTYNYSTNNDNISISRY